jgi:hypothetical protein
VKLIETKTLTGAAASIVFTSIPQDGTDLVLLCSLRQAGAGFSQVNMSFNGVGGTSYSDRTLEGTGTAVANGSRTSQAVIRITAIVGSEQTANTFGNALIYIPNYSGNTNKSVSLDAVTENNAAAAIQSLVAGLFSNTSAITSITLTSQSGENLVVGSTVSLYKITSGSDGIVTVS